MTFVHISTFPLIPRKLFFLSVLEIDEPQWYGLGVCEGKESSTKTFCWELHEISRSAQ